ncbi:MAG: hypothetical protein ABF979_02540 [Gluconobacter sp.]
MTKKNLLIISSLLIPLHSFAASPAAYKGTDGSYQPLKVVSAVGNNEKPVVPAYKGTDNQWHATTVVMMTCGLDDAGHPVPCQAPTGVESNAVVLDSSGYITAPVSGSIDKGTVGGTQLSGLLNTLSTTMDAFQASNQKDVPNGVVGRDAVGNILFAQQQNNSGQTEAIHFHPGNPYIANNDVFIWCDTATGSDGQGHCHFDNLSYGNTWEFNNRISTGTGIFGADVTVNGQSVADALAKLDRTLEVGYEGQSVYQSATTTPFITMSRNHWDAVNQNPNTLMLGGSTANSLVHLKASCANTSGGDEGGSCYQFTDMGGPEINNRSGAGITDGINIDARSSDVSPLDALGGNTLATESDGSYRVVGTSYSIGTDAAAGASSFTLVGALGCGVQAANSLAGCQISGLSLAGASGTVSSETAKITQAAYNPSTNLTTVTLPSGYTLASAVAANTGVTAQYLASDGIAHAIRFLGANEVSVYPALNTLEMNLFQNRMAIWTNYAKGMNSTEGGYNPDATNVDLPNYYLAYFSGWDAANTDSAHSTFFVESGYYPGTSSAQPGWCTVGEWGAAATAAPGQNSGDQIDNQITYTHPATGQETHTSQYHNYSQPTLFLGMNNKNFNNYNLQYRVGKTDSVTRSFDNEWDFWANQDHPGEVSMKGLTLAYNGTSGPLANDSYMLRLSGANTLGIGLWVGGVIPGGETIKSDSGFFDVRNQANMSADVNATQPISMMGNGVVNGKYTELSFYGSQDGSSGNGSLHLGALESSNPSLQYNAAPLCDGTAYMLDSGISASQCVQAGQIVFDPSGYTGGVALAVGQGSNTKLGLVTESDGTARAPAGLRVGAGNAPSFSQVDSQTISLTNQAGDTNGFLRLAGIVTTGVSTFGGDTVTATTATAKAFRETLSTPSSSTADCTPGDFTDDANYHYVCVASNSWKRVELQSW